MPATRYSHIQVRPASQNIGAFIDDVDVSIPQSPEVYAEIQQALAGPFGKTVPREIFLSLDGHPEISVLKAARECASCGGGALFDMIKIPEFQVRFTDLGQFRDTALCGRRLLASRTPYAPDHRRHRQANCYAATAAVGCRITTSRT